MARQLTLDYMWSPSNDELKVLVTGASGFIGSFMVEEALAKGYQVWAGVRPTSNRQYLQDSRIHFIELDFGNEEVLREQLLAFKKEQGAWDYIIHCAGVTKCLHKEDFYTVNFAGSRCFVDRLVSCKMVPKQFLFLSSLGAFGLQHECEPHTPITAADVPQPNTLYGESKYLFEKYLQEMGNFPYVIFRPTGVYGPRERDYFLMVKSITRHFDFALGFRRQDITFVYVKDLVKAVFLAIEAGVTEKAYFVSDGQAYDSGQFGKLICKELGNPFVIRMVCPLFLAKIIFSISEQLASWSGKCTTLNRDKYKIMKQRNWICDIEPLEKELGYHPDYDLERGTHEMIAWYKKEKWL